MPLAAWALRHHVSIEAMGELTTLLTLDTLVPPTSKGTGEAQAQAQVRLEASKRGWRLWRNNSGAGKLENGSFIRWGLSNDSAAVNAVCKGSDLIGLRPVLIGPEHVGRTLGQFVAREIKAPGWKYAGTPREVAQLKFMEIVVALGGDASFSTGGL